MNALEIAREELGDEISDDDLNYIIWEYTGFPSFWSGEPETEFRKQLREFRDG